MKCVSAMEGPLDKPHTEANGFWAIALAFEDIRGPDTVYIVFPTPACKRRALNDEPSTNRL